jgi:cell surface protein SprA
VVLNHYSGLKQNFSWVKPWNCGTFPTTGEARNIVVQGGGVMNTLKFNAIDYEENQHYFLGHYFLNKYDNALLNYPQINSKINITRLEVWVLDQGTAILPIRKVLSESEI